MGCVGGRARGGHSTPALHFPLLLVLAYLCPCAALSYHLVLTHRAPDLHPNALQDHGDLEKSINTTLDENTLQRPHNYVTKIIQLYDTMDVRFGVMLVGPTGGGKTTCCNILQGALTRLRELRHTNQAYQVGCVWAWCCVCVCGLVGGGDGGRGELALAGPTLGRLSALTKKHTSSHAQQIPNPKNETDALKPQALKALILLPLHTCARSPTGGPHLHLQPQVHQDG